MKILVSLLMGFILSMASVDINTANEKELESLKGIGMSKAKAITAYRTKNCFKSIDDLVKVKGIGKKILEKNRDNLEVSKCK